MAATLSDGVYQIQNVHYTKSYIGLQYHDIIVAGRYETQDDDPHIKWTVKVVDESGYKITISSGDRYIGAVFSPTICQSKKVVLYDIAFEWELSSRDVGRWFIRDSSSGFGLYLPDGNNGTEVDLTRDGAGDVSYWYFESPPTE
ncbi:hypothetical protein K503DRAFT_781669 [Rhizopogon vinicolor AM-OR11-026]|uniref:Ricin B lectin domain-containing protein n=1 Tax=Rhizopogon vinicolor AM-OR11-026 TaxID=1314800 RepID=A0A1B7N5H7_9AGAM|nr:hypothetical protein K503DRAFT_781669 [Rhizopogon vinicolor AM-OR11-026]